MMFPYGLDGGRSDSFIRSRAGPLTSFKNSHAKVKVKAQNTTENRHGRRYGYSPHNQAPNNDGNLSCGRERDPPAKGLLYTSEDCARYRRRVTYPIVAPTAHAIGMSPDTWALFVESVSSAIMLLATPMFPLRKPAIHRLSERSATIEVGRYSLSTSLRGQ